MSRNGLVVYLEKAEHYPDLKNCEPHETGDEEYARHRDPPALRIRVNQTCEHQSGQPKSHRHAFAWMVAPKKTEAAKHQRSGSKDKQRLKIAEEQLPDDRFV
jgi:hypothetical protein